MNVGEETAMGFWVRNGFVLRCGVVFLVSLLAGAATGRENGRLDSVAPEDTSETLQPGLSIERLFVAGGIHRYRLPLSASEYARIVVDHFGIELVVSLVAPDGRRVIEKEASTGDWGNEQLSWIAESGGTYSFEVRAADKEALPGCYSVRLEELRPSSPIDRRLIVAEMALVRSYEVRGQADVGVQREALVRLREALAIWRSVGDLYQEGIVLHTIGEISAALGDYQDAIDQYSEALLVRKAAMDRPGEAYTLFLRGTIEAFVAQTSDALGDYMLALSIEQQLGDVRQEAEVRSNLGRLYDNVGEKQKALEEYDRALPLIRATHNRNAEARTLARLALLYQFQGDKQKALTYGLQGLALSRAMGDRQLEAYIGAIVGRVYADLSDSDAALRYLGDALKAVQAMGERHPEATMLVDIGRVHAGRGEIAEALDYYSKALPLLGTIRDPRFEASALIFVGQASIAGGEPKKALSSFEQAMAVARAARDPYREADALTNLGAVHASQGETDRGLDELRQALMLRRRVMDRFGEAATSYQVARVERDRGNLTVSLALIEGVLAAFESVRGQVASPELRASFRVSVQDYYEFYTDLLMRLHARDESGGFAALALQASERARARSLLDLLTEARADVRRGVDVTLLERERSLRRRLNEKLQGHVQAPGAPRPDPDAASLAGEVQSLTTELQQLEAEIRTSSPQYAALTQPQPLGLVAIQSLLDPETLLLEYSLGTERSFVWAVTADSLAVYALPRRSEIEALARQLYEQLAGARPMGERRDGFARASRDLSRVLLGPLVARLKKRLVIVADGALEYLPFAALPVPAKTGAKEPTFLVSGHEIVNVPSASVMAVQRQELLGRRPAARSLAVLADPVFEREDERVTKASAHEEGGGSLVSSRNSLNVPQDSLPSVLRDVDGKDGGVRFSRLPFTRREAKAILELAPIRERTEAFDFEASLATATSEELSRYRYVHFATHGLLDSVHPELSGLIFSLVDREGRSQDGFLPATEVFNLKFPAELVVLSACRTALGKEIRGEGLVGLTRAFMYAGARRVVASLWRVDDAATAALMRKFYVGMLGPRKLRPAAALREAQLSISKQKRWQHPYYWAAFVLQGEWR